MVKEKGGGELKGKREKTKEEEWKQRKRDRNGGKEEEKKNRERGVEEGEKMSHVLTHKLVFQSMYKGPTGPSTHQTDL